MSHRIFDGMFKSVAFTDNTIGIPINHNRSIHNVKRLMIAG